MLLDLSRIRTPHEQFSEAYAAEVFAGDEDDFRVAAPVSLAFEIFKDNSHYRLVGRSQTALELPCSRCLDPMTVPVDAAFDLRYQPRTTGPGGAGHAGHAGDAGDDVERELEEDDLATAFYDNEEIDLGQLLREQFYLAVPMKPLCDEACRGLCPSCGTNLNRGTCECRRDWIDPRLAPLHELRAKTTTHD